MTGGGSVQLARILGIRIGASPSWFLVLFLMIYVLSGLLRGRPGGIGHRVAYGRRGRRGPRFFLSLVLHELGHAIVARRNGIGISGIDLWFFGGLARMTRDTVTPGEEFRVAAAGPAGDGRIVGPARWPCAALATSTRSPTSRRSSATRHRPAPR